MENLNKPMCTAFSSELLSPVSIIQRNIEVLKNHCSYVDTSLSEEVFSFAENSIDSILGFIENFHILNTSDEMKANLNPQWFSFQELITQVREELRHANLDVSRLKVIALPRQSTVLLDRYLINRILINLLSNALKFSGKKVELEITLINPMLTMAVRDYGIGIPASQLTEVFNPFVRAENASRFPGTGIGLSIVSRAVECLDGTVSVKSEPNQSTEFRVDVPYRHIRPAKRKSTKNQHSLNINPS